jgi:glycogen debranching enzyme
MSTKNKAFAAAKSVAHGQSPKEAIASIKTPSAADQSFQPNGPKTPADEAIDFFQSPVEPTEDPIRVYELVLDADGGANKDRSV